MKPGAKDGILAPKLAKTLVPAEVEHLEDGSELSQCRLSERDFSAAQADGVLWDGVLLRRVNFTQAKLTHLRLFDCRLEGCEASGAGWEKVRMRRVEVVGCRFSGADLA
jgi:uncharacterized protein YjbI with pentapeptide repeats